MTQITVIESVSGDELMARARADQCYDAPSAVLECEAGMVAARIDATLEWLEDRKAAQAERDQARSAANEEWRAVAVDVARRAYAAGVTQCGERHTTNHGWQRDWLIPAEATVWASDSRRRAVEALRALADLCTAAVATGPRPEALRREAKQLRREASALKRALERIKASK
jgi:hypothetical protein